MCAALALAPPSDHRTTLIITPDVSYTVHHTDNTEHQHHHLILSSCTIAIDITAIMKL